MADKRVSDLPRATELGDNDLLVVEQAGEAKALPGAKIKSPPTDEQVAAAVEAYLAKNPPQAAPSQALALVRQLLGLAVYTGDASGLLTQLDALLGGGEPPDEPDVPVVPPDEPEVVTETLKCGYNYADQTTGATRYPDITTFEFEPTERTQYNCWPLIYPSTIGGGILSVEFDASKCKGFQMMFYLFGSDGRPYKLGLGTGPKPDSTISTNTTRPTVGDALAGGMSNVEWNKDPGSAPGWTTVAGSFTLAIPDGCNIMIAVQNNGYISEDGSVTNGNTFYDLWESGWLTATITKEV